MTQISITRNGKTCTGSYTIENSVITVRHAGRSKATQIGGMAPDVLAKTILGEMIDMRAE